MTTKEYYATVNLIVQLQTPASQLTYNRQNETDSTVFWPEQSSASIMLCLSPKRQCTMGDVNAKGKELLGSIVENSKEALFIRSIAYKRSKTGSKDNERKPNLEKQHITMALCPVRSRFKSNMKQKSFEFNKPKIPLLHAQRMKMKTNKVVLSSTLTRRGSLVQRTHSPIHFHISQKLAVDLAQENMNNPTIANMCSNSEQPTEPTSGLTCGTSEKKRKSNLDTSQTLICPVAKKRLSQEPTSYIINCKRSKSDSSNCNSFDVRIIPPTHTGISEASRIMRCRRNSSSYGEIVSIPTEKEYTLLTYVPFQKPTSTSITAQNTRRRVWDTVSEIMLMKPSEASVYLQHPIQAYNFVAFSSNKTFMYEQRSSSSESEIHTSIDRSPFKITFSESHEVLNRLSSAFWPGTVTIFAPVRTRRLKNRRYHTSSEEGGEHVLINGHESMTSISSIISLASEESEDSNHGVKVATPSIPIVPNSVLCSERELHISGGGDEKIFIGMRCPSHPIAKKILSETYAQEEGKLANPLKGAIIGMNIPTSEKTCRGVCAELRSFVFEGDNKINEMPIINVMNGEDCCEKFSVPPCQFGELPSVSLVIDTPRRNIVLLRSGVDSISAKIPAAAFNFDVRAEEVKHVLCNLHNGGVKSRAIAAVMSKWSITEIEI